MIFIQNFNRKKKMKNEKNDVSQKIRFEEKSKSSFWRVAIMLLLISIIISIVGFNQQIKEKLLSLYLIHEQLITYDEDNNNLVHWKFTLNISSIDSFNCSQISPKSKNIQVPHTWNNLDGQDGGGDYLRTISAYQTLFQINDTILNQKRRTFIEFGAVNSIATVYLNGHYIGNHTGGFQIFRLDLTDFIQEGDNILTVFADNRKSTSFYPQFADFTFFGGIYRPVKLLFKSNEAHFELNDYGSQGLYITPSIIDEHKGIINIKPLIKSYKNDNSIKYNYQYTIYDRQNNVVKEVTTDSNDFNLTIDNYQKWNGREDPYLYSLTAKLLSNGLNIDKIDSVKFGFRTFSCNHTGFYLNGNRMRLNGVSRHQDRLNKGWAVSHADEIEDIDLITEIGANAVRFAHYQQSQGMFDLCDEKGLIVWVEIPFISMFLNTTESNENLKQILTEMIKQNYNHPCVAMWGLMNEIGIGGESAELYKVIGELNELSKSLDSRMTTSAIFQGTDYNSPLNRFTDIFGYNLYYGWYSGTIKDNDNVIDSIHNVKENPPLALTEYGAECNTKFHSEVPRQNDYSEEYQLSYHMSVYSIIESKNFLWGTYVWNMFDFAADSRNEGGVQGRNNKGLVTYDRKTKKDSFYYYKAKWSKSPFIHICSKRFYERAISTINVTILSNLKSLDVYLNDELVKSFNGDFDTFSVVKINLKNGINVVKAVSEGIEDVAKFKKVDRDNPSYSLPISDEDETMFDHPDGYYSVYDTVGSVLKSEEALNLIKKYYGKPIPSSALMIVKSMKIIRVIRMAGASVFPPERINDINEALNKIPKKL